MANDEYLHDVPMFVVRDLDPDDARIYEGGSFEVKAHKRSCFFCTHLTDLFWDYSNGPYMFFCDVLLERRECSPGKFGLDGKCPSFDDIGDCRRVIKND